MNQLLKIHWMALHPIKVCSILAGIILSFGSIELAGRWTSPIFVNEPIPLRYFTIFETLVATNQYFWLATITVWMCFIWMTLGGAATRRMSLDLLDRRRESFLRSIVYCFKKSLLFPSALAVVCFYFILLARVYPWLLVLLLPVWLYAGLYYGALTLENISLPRAARRIHRKLRHWPELLKMETSYLISFAISTGVVYTIAIAYGLIVRFFVGQRGLAAMLSSLNTAEGILIAPALLYALGYTTSNLKSLQVLLYLNMTRKQSTQLPKLQIHPTDSVRPTAYTTKTLPVK
jgi:hypothetical protein